MLGTVNLQSFAGISSMPQKAASAWSAANSDIVGAVYKPLIYCGEQIVKGVNYWFIAEQTIITAQPQRRIVTIAINEFNRQYKIVPDSIKNIFA